jgi:hypothetical protein
MELFVTFHAEKGELKFLMRYKSRVETALDVSGDEINADFEGKSRKTSILDREDRESVGMRMQMGERLND